MGSIVKTPKKATDGRVVDTPKKATNSVSDNDTQNHRLPTFVHNLGYITYVDVAGVSVFEKLYDDLPKPVKFTPRQMQEAEKELKASKEWREWISDAVSNS